MAAKKSEASSKAPSADTLRQRNCRAKNPTKSLEYSKRHYAKNTEVCIERSNNWRKQNPEKYCAHNADFHKRTYERLAGRPRPDRCDVCKTVGVVHFDHCHKNGHFRGWLCFGCNTALGAVKDSPKMLRKLAEYLDADKARDTSKLEKLPAYLEACGQRRQRKRNDTKTDGKTKPSTKTSVKAAAPKPKARTK